MKGNRNIKSLLLRRIAMLISMCYLLGPLHQPINTFLHFISHQLEAPTQVLSHENDHSNHAINDDIAHTMMVNQLSHDHHVIDLLESFLENSNTDVPNDDSLVNKVKIDKHTVEVYEVSIHAIVYCTKPSINSNPYPILEGYQQKVEHPPNYL